jgi:hypothetical protein
MWVEIVLVVLAVSLVYWALGLHDTPIEPESPETDGESIDDFFQIFGAILTFLAAVVLVVGLELTLLIIRARRQR